MLPKERFAYIYQIQQHASLSIPLPPKRSYSMIKLTIQRKHVWKCWREVKKFACSLEAKAKWIIPYSGLNPLTCRILICLTIVLFPDSPAPANKQKECWGLWPNAVVISPAPPRPPTEGNRPTPA